MSNFVFPILAQQQAVNLDNVTDFRKSAYESRHSGYLHTITFNLNGGGFISWTYKEAYDRDAEWDELEMSIRARQTATGES